MLHITSRSSLYLFVKEIPFEQFLRVEKSTLKAEEWGNEVLGVMLVPLVQYKDTARGLPRFLNNQFCSSLYRWWDCGEEVGISSLMFCVLYLDKTQTDCRICWKWTKWKKHLKWSLFLQWFTKQIVKSWLYFTKFPELSETTKHQDLKWKHIF